ncbi:hypothetical protein BKA61DRAFT_727001 [Leptodontidium sp. MPI-SDFR-AT-0119]|nr:hypothetical protein BKA61DRAFT_727001 [Leptodontidium sp. MPI-SDFR-AT-0119]
MDLWIQVKCLRESCSRRATFTEVCSTFQTDFERISLAYHQAEVAVQAHCIRQNKPFTGPLSKMAKNEGMLVEFCLSRLVEIREDEMRTGHDAVQTVIMEVWRHGNWQSNIEFLTTVPQSALDIDLQPILDTHQDFLQRVLIAFRGFLHVICTHIATIFSPLVRKCTIGFCLFILAMLAITVLAHVASWAFALMESEVVRFIKSVPILSQILWVLGFVESWFPWTHTTSPPSSLVPLGTSPDAYPGYLSNFTAILSAILPTFSRFSSKIAYSTADDSSMPTGEVFQKIANDTLYMANISSNMTVLPMLLGFSLNSIVKARSTVRASTVQQKSAMLPLFDELESNMELLIDGSMSFNSGVPDLLRIFEIYLSFAIDSVEEVESPDIRGSLSLQMSSACVLWWLNLQQPPGNNLGSYACGGSFIVTTAMFYCVDAAPTLSGGSFCSKCLAHAPEGLMMPGVQRAINQRRMAAQDLKNFVQHFSARVEELHTLAEASVVLCQKIKNSFAWIQVHALKNQNEAIFTSTVVTNQLSDAGYWKRWFDQAGHTSSKNRLIELQMEMGHLREILAVHMLASDSFVAAANLLSQWRIDLQNLQKTLHFLDSSTRDDTWRTVWDSYEDWNRLKRKMHDLKILALDPLARAYSDLRVRSRQDLAALHKVSAECYAATHEAIRRGNARPTAECVFARLHFG